MIPYRYLKPPACEKIWPVHYADHTDPKITDKLERYIVLHEVPCRYDRSWNVKVVWPKYKGVITWNPLTFEEHSGEFNMVFSDQFQNMNVEVPLEYVPLCDRPHDVCGIYGRPASRDKEIMTRRYDLLLRLRDLGMSANAYGVTPDNERVEYRPAWKSVLRGKLPLAGKGSALIKHKFSIAFENSRHPRWASGWVTEKIYDCLGNGTVPIYWGAPNVTDYIPPEVFIDYREFDTDLDLHKYLTETPVSVFEKMSRDGIDFFNTVHFDKYLDVYENLQ